MTVQEGIEYVFQLPAAGLVPSPFKQLYFGEPPDDSTIPFAVATPTGDENDLSQRTRQHEWHRGSFKIEVVDRTAELVANQGIAVQAALRDKEATINTKAGAMIVRNLTYKNTKGPDQLQPDLWMSELMFEVMYPVARPA